MLEKIISGGQTGVDRAALDVAIDLGIPHGGWCPRGRRAEDGVIANHYELVETVSDDYSVRTKKNINDSDGTLIIVPSMPITVTDGTVLTINEVIAVKKPYLIIDSSSQDDCNAIIIAWLNEKRIKILNIAGPRESQAPGIYDGATKILRRLLSGLI